jgi:hypothetical protein
MVSIVSSAGPPTLAEIAARYAIPEDRFDHAFGVVEVDDVAHEFTILVDEDVAPRIRSSPGWTVVGAFSNPPIAPFGPPTDS